jgi:hypothetical protein
VDPSYCGCMTTKSPRLSPGEPLLFGDAKDNRYVTLQVVARTYGVSTQTVRRRVLEGTLFQGAKKIPGPAAGSEIWVIPHSEAAAISLTDLSPRTYHYRPTRQAVPQHDHHSTPLSMLEDRVATLEKLVQVLERAEKHAA